MATSRRVGSFRGFPFNTFESKRSMTTSPPAMGSGGERRPRLKGSGRRVSLPVVLGPEAQVHSEVRELPEVRAVEEVQGGPVHAEQALAEERPQEARSHVVHGRPPAE